MKTILDRTALESLLARVTACDGPDREVDGQIALAFGLPQAFFAQFSKDIDGNPWRGFSNVDGPSCFGGTPKWGGGGRGWVAEAYTASIDAALALVGCVLPGWQWMLRGGWAKLWMPNGRPPGNDFDAHAATPALALCAALLKALVAQAGDVMGEPSHKPR